MYGRRYPIYYGEDAIVMLEEGIYKVRLEGITHIVVKEKQAKKYLKVKENIKQFAMDLIRKFNVYDSGAIGVMFLEKINQKIKIHPVVWVKSMDTLFYETACGSGTVAAAVIQNLNNNSSQLFEIIQPSGQVISTNILKQNGIVLEVIISGKVNTDGILREIDVDI